MKKRKKVIIVVILLLVVLGVCCGLYYNHMVSNEKDKIKEIARKNSRALLEVTEKLEYGESLSYDELVEKLVDKENMVEGSKIKISINDTEILENETYKIEDDGKIVVKASLEKEYTYKIITTVTEKVESTRELELEVQRMSED